MKNLLHGALLLSLFVGASTASFAKKEEATTENLSPEESTAKLLKNNDFNKDGKLAKNEVNFSFRMKRFNRVDKNKDGYLDEQELKDSFEKTKQYNEQRASK